MAYETYFNMLLNIGLLVLIAALLTNLEFVRDLFLEEQGSLFSKTALAVIFGVISIVSTAFLVLRFPRVLNPEK